MHMIRIHNHKKDFKYDRTGKNLRKMLGIGEVLKSIEENPGMLLPEGQSSRKAKKTFSEDSDNEFEPLNLVCPIDTKQPTVFESAMFIDPEQPTVRKSEILVDPVPFP